MSAFDEIIEAVDKLDDSPLDIDALLEDEHGMNLDELRELAETTSRLPYDVDGLVEGKPLDELREAVDGMERSSAKLERLFPDDTDDGDPSAGRGRPTERD